MEEQADIALIAACQQGDPRAFREVFDIYRDRIFALCRRMSGNPQDAEDLVQDVFVRAFRSIGSFRAESTFGTWLYRIAVNCCSSSRRRHALPADSLDDLTGASVPRSDRPLPDDQLLRKEMAARIEAAVADLPDSLRVLFVLATMEGLRYKEVADIVGITEDAAKMRIHRARKRVRDALRDYL